MQVGRGWFTDRRRSTRFAEPLERGPVVGLDHDAGVQGEAFHERRQPWARQGGHGRLRGAGPTRGCRPVVGQEHLVVVLGKLRLSRLRQGRKHPLSDLDGEGVELFGCGCEQAMKP